jgi:hypothetical protein
MFTKVAPPSAWHWEKNIAQNGESYDLVVNDLSWSLQIAKGLSKSSRQTS